jgi:hypothetical protein
LNNSAALCIEVGEFDRAIWSLQRALKLSEKHTQDRKADAKANDPTTSKFGQCSLEGCIAFSDANSLYSSTGCNSVSSLNRLNATVNSTDPSATTHASTSTTSTDSNNIVRQGNKRRRIEITSLEAKKAGEDSIAESDADAIPAAAQYNTIDNENDYYVYNRPIRVPQKGHEMGSLLFLIILFNLALAHHLKTTTMSAVRNPDSEGREKAIAKALMLYQLVLEYWSKLQHRMEEDNQDRESCSDKKTSYTSIWFRMILHNNLGQIYRWTENPTKEHECLKDLLSNVWVVTDQAIQRNSPMALRKGPGSGFKRDLEGFLANTAALTVHERCAEAA